MTQRRAKIVRQYIVYQLKMIELLHLTLLSFHVSGHKLVPENVMGHDSDRFVETLLSVIVTTFVSMVDQPESTNVRHIWKDLYPRHARAIDRIWDSQIAPGERIMKRYRDQAGAHGDSAPKYFAAKLALNEKSEIVLNAMHALLRLSVLLSERQAKEVPELPSEVEEALLDIELKLPQKAFNRTWLRQMQLIGSGSFSKKFY